MASSSRRLAGGVLGVALLGSFFLVGGAPGSSDIVQPLEFSHRLHFEQDTACTDCHIRAEEGVYATLPGLKTCLLCHEEAQGESAMEPLVREYAEREEAIPWVQVNRVEGHVYFSHAAHVTFGEMSCEECHGDMTVLDEPVTRSQIEDLTMDACMECHAQRGASNDCLICHK